MADHDNVFGSSVSVDERAKALQNFTAEQCRRAFSAPCLQATTRKQLESRLRRLEKTNGK